MRFGHVNLAARDWRALATFYETVLGCERVGPERDLAGGTLDRALAVEGVRVRGVHLRLPGHGERGPTLEVFSYEPAAPGPAPAINRPGVEARPESPPAFDRACGPWAAFRSLRRSAGATPRSRALPTARIHGLGATVDFPAGPLGHLAFAVEDVDGARREVLGAGGRDAGELVDLEVEGAGTIRFVYMRDPEGNLLELQRWSS